LDGRSAIGVFQPMRNFFKSTAVLLTVLSVGFMATSIAMYFGHPDVRAEMTTDAMQAYSFTANPGETITWSVTARDGDKANLGTFDTALKALARAHQDLQTRLGSETREMADLTTQITGDTGETAMFRAKQAQDIAAVRQRKQQLDQVTRNLQNLLQQRSGLEQSLAEQSKQIQLETASRRTDVTRLQNELEEARTDLFRLTEIRRELTDELLRLQLDMQALQERVDQINDQTSAN
jgi:chromosome segregation ATPase